jgi:signal transduction histidine kinase
MSSFGWPRRLRTRLFASYVVVVLAGSAAMLLVGTVVTRTVYEHRLGGFGLGRGQGRGSQVSEAELQTALDESLWPALLAGVGAALATAVIVASFVGRRLLRPIDELRTAARQMADGDYSVQVPVPSEIELASLANDVNQLGAHLAETEQRRAHLVAEVTHELRTPITVIRGHIEAMIDGVIEPSDEVFATISDEASRLQRMVDDLTMLSRADEGLLEVDLVELDLGKLVADAAERLRPQFDHEGVALVAGRSGARMSVLGDADRLMQIITNLLGNALGHTPSGGSVTVMTGHEGDIVWVEVNDTGPGIPEGEHERIFERFYRGAQAAPSTDRHVRAGRGIGLTIARSLARAHGGDVRSLHRVPGTGATFRITIPAA